MASKPYRDIIFDEYAPDFGGSPRNDDVPGYLTDAVNVRLTPNGWRGQPSFADVASATVATSSGGGTLSVFDAWVVSAGLASKQTSFFYVANGKIFESRAAGTDTWRDVSPASGSVTQPCRFVQFGTTILVICPQNVVISKNMTSAQTVLFTALTGTGTIPVTLYGNRVRDHLVLAHFYGIGTADAYKLQWSAIGDYTDWPTPGTADALAKEAGTQTVREQYGAILDVIGGEKFGIIIQDSALTRMTYVGGSAVYEFDTYFTEFDGVGSRPVSDGKLWYFLTKTGVIATDGYSAKNISDGFVDEAFFSNTISFPQSLGSLSSSNSSVYDAFRSEIIFGNLQYDGSAQYYLKYNTRSGQFCVMSDSTTQALHCGMSSNRQTYAINGSNRKLRQLNGATGIIGMQTGYIEIDPGYKVQFQGAHLLGAGVPGSLSLAYKATSSLASVDVSQSGFTTLTAAGRGMKANARVTEQFMAFRVTGTGSESQLIKGIRVYFERAEPAT